MANQTFKEEKTRGGIVKGRRFDPPVSTCFLTVSIICNVVMAIVAKIKIKFELVIYNKAPLSPNRG